MLFDVNVSALVTHNRQDIASAFRDTHINENVCDHKDGRIGKVGCVINFNRYFYRYQPPRPLEEIEADIRMLEKEIPHMLVEIV